jgi:DUF1680 family protein
MDESLIMEIWDTFREYIPEKHKDTAANQYVDYLLGKDIEIAVLEGFVGYDPHLDDAIKNVVDEAKALDGDEDTGYYEEDEDY